MMKCKPVGTTKMRRCNGEAVGFSILKEEDRAPWQDCTPHPQKKTKRSTHCTLSRTLFAHALRST